MRNAPGTRVLAGEAKSTYTPESQDLKAAESSTC